MKISTRLLLAFLGILYLGSCTSKIAPPVKTDWEKENLKGNVRSVSEYSTQLDSLGNVLDSAGENNPQTTLYNTSGFKTEYITDWGKQVYTYTSSGRIAKTTFLRDDNAHKIVDTYEYDRSGRLLKHTIESEYHNGEEIQKSKSVITYEKFDKNGNSIQWSFKGDVRMMDYHAVEAYDEQNRLIKSEIYDTNNRIVYSHIYTYNIKGQKLSQTSKIYNENESEEHFSYDDKGNVALISVLDKNNADSSHNKIEFIYRYDNQGNWIERFTLNNGVKESIDKRVIVYY